MHEAGGQVSLDKGGQADTRGAALRAASEARGPSEDEEPEPPAAAGKPAMHLMFAKLIREALGLTSLLTHPSDIERTCSLWHVDDRRPEACQLELQQRVCRGNILHMPSAFVLYHRDR